MKALPKSRCPLKLAQVGRNRLNYDGTIFETDFDAFETVEAFEELSVRNVDYGKFGIAAHFTADHALAVRSKAESYRASGQIGRASCRERVSVRVDLGGGRIIKKKNKKQVTQSKKHITKP